MSSFTESSDASQASTDHPEPARDRRFDIVLNGATGFVGRLTVRHLAKNAHGARIALAGRDEARLQALKTDLGVDWPALVVDMADPRQVDAVAASTAAVASTVGRYGLPMALSCAQAGTSYADLSGEVPFVRDSIRMIHDIAAGTGASRSCGVPAGGAVSRPVQRTPSQSARSSPAGSSTGVTSCVSRAVVRRAVS
jgi:hypothetical protein